MKTENMHIAELAMYRQLEGLYRCDSMPAGRAYLFSYDCGNHYIKPDGTLEPFDFAIENNKYRDDQTWRLLGAVPRLPPDGAFDLTALVQILQGAN
jgi:hypothetical protein